MRRTLMLVCLSTLLGCGSRPKATVEVDFVRRAPNGTEDVYNSATIGGARAGSRVSGGVADDAEMFTVTLSEISKDGVEVTIAHPKQKPQKIALSYEEQKDVVFGDNAIVRVRAKSESK
jgi:hypothetical protein